ncbi:MAG: hypothetical protein IAG10_35665 [Planctomycetaceae bacterium]|nr:hypothetical protein [Planctomycetaceae bacterium]
MLGFLRHPLIANRSETQGAMSVAWIDGVGCFWISLAERVAIGGPETPSAKPLHPRETADIAILSDLKRRHATIVRTGEGYLLEAHGPARVAGREVQDRAMLGDGTLIELGRSVRWRFRQPSAWSLSARLDFVSDHRPTQAVDGLVLLADTCLLGPGDENHIVCPDWAGQVLLVRQKDELWCRSRLDLTVNGHRLGSGRRLRSGDVVTGEDLRFRIEERG